MALLTHLLTNSTCVMMMKKAAILCLVCAVSFTASGQADSAAGQQETITAPPPDTRTAPFSQPRYKLNLPVDAAITIPSTVWTLYAFGQNYSKPNIDSAVVAGLNKNNIPAFDRWAIRHSDKAAAASDIFFYSSMPYPFILLADKAIRKDALTIGALYWEAMAITGLLYTGGDYFVDRYRPETYDVTKPFGERQSGNEKNAFFAGHPALVSTATFFTASIYDHYHPTSGIKWVLYGVAAAATGTTIYLRYRAGKHFPSDLFVGTMVGVSSGMLVPRLHRYKPARKHAWMLMPSAGDGYGLAATYRF
jgi:hypothetical protein